jgi:hypothetical protein
MKVWLRSVLPALVVAAGLLCASNGADAAPLPGGSASSGAPAGTWIAKSGLPTAAAEVLQAEIDRQIARHGGVQVSPYEVAYDGGDPIMVFADPLTGQFPTDAGDRVEARRPVAGPLGGSSLTSLTPLTTSYRYGCPYGSTSGWTCFYQNIDFNHYSCPGGASPPCSDGGRLLQFQSCGTQSLATYGFSDQTSSWVNNTGSHVAVYATSGAELWDEAPGGASAYVGDAYNDRADSFWLIC